MLKIRPEDLPETMDFLEATWEQFIPKGTFYYLLLDDWIDNVHPKTQTEQSLCNLGRVSDFCCMSGFIRLSNLLLRATYKRDGGRIYRKYCKALSRNSFCLWRTNIPWPFAYYYGKMAQDRIESIWVQEFLFWGEFSCMTALTTVSYQALKETLIQSTL